MPIPGNTSGPGARSSGFTSLTHTAPTESSTLPGLRRQLSPDSIFLPWASRTVPEKDDATAGIAVASAKGEDAGTAGTKGEGAEAATPKAPTRILHAMSTNLLATYRSCDPGLVFDCATCPKRVLTQPSKPSDDSDFDNESSDYILRVGEDIGSHSDHTYRIIDLLGKGTFGQVVRARNLKTGTMVAVKVVKSLPAYHKQGRIEVKMLKKLNGRFDRDNEHHILRLLHDFEFRGHLCLVFELLGINLYEIIKRHRFRGYPIDMIREFTRQIIDSLLTLTEANIIHCDLKPENILMDPSRLGDIKVVDFGSACRENSTIYTYIQSRFYRSPEVILGIRYGKSIDLWSLGCIAAELYLGLPIFPGTSEFTQLDLIVRMLGQPPFHMLRRARHATKFYYLISMRDAQTAIQDQEYHIGRDKRSVDVGRGPPSTQAARSGVAPQYDDDGNPLPSIIRNGQQIGRRSILTPSPRVVMPTGRSSSTYTRAFKMKHQRLYCDELGITPKRPRPYFRYDKLEDIVDYFPMPEGLTEEGAATERAQRKCFLHFLKGLLNIDPTRRWTAFQAQHHPFITGEPWTEDYAPPSNPLYQYSRIQDPPGREQMQRRSDAYFAREGARSLLTRLMQKRGTTVKYPVISGDFRNQFRGIKHGPEGVQHPSMHATGDLDLPDIPPFGAGRCGRRGLGGRH